MTLTAEEQLRQLRKWLRAKRADLVKHGTVGAFMYLESAPAIEVIDDTLDQISRLSRATQTRRGRQ